MKQITEQQVSIIQVALTRAAQADKELLSLLIPNENQSHARLLLERINKYETLIQELYK
jgi:hypothetical protein